MNSIIASEERLVHFRCDACKGWWSIGDAPIREYWYCPWCGVKLCSTVKVKEPNHYRLATDIVRDVWIKRINQHSKNRTLNGAMGAFIRSDSKMSFDEFLAKLRERDMEFLAIRNFGHKSLEALAKYFVEEASNETAPL